MKPRLITIFIYLSVFTILANIYILILMGTSATTEAFSKASFGGILSGCLIGVMEVFVLRGIMAAHSFKIILITRTTFYTVFFILFTFLFYAMDPLLDHQKAAGSIFESEWQLSPINANSPDTIGKIPSDLLLALNKSHIWPDPRQLAEQRPDGSWTIISESINSYHLVKQGQELSISFEWYSSLSAYFMDNFLRIFGFLIVLIILINLFIQIIPILGSQVFMDILSGKYHKAVEEARIFMFLDIKDSTSIAEKLGHMRFAALLSDFFRDISTAISQSKGIIHKYMGDEIIVTWPSKQGVLQERYLVCWEAICLRIASRHHYYQNKYGIIPEFKTGFHSGLTVVTEIGNAKREIAFLGDTVNTAARIQSACSELNTSILISSNLAIQTTEKWRSRLISLGHHHLKGKELTVELYTLQ